MFNITIKQLLEAGVHFGHPTKKWNPKMAEYIFTTRNGIHIVDLQGAKDGTTPNLSVVQRVVEKTGLFVEVGGGIRNMDVVKKYIDAGVGRVILGTAAVKDEEFLRRGLKDILNFVMIVVRKVC